MTEQGLPTATTLFGMFLVTTLPAPIVVLSPIETPGQMITPPPIQTLFPMQIGAVSSCPVSRTVGSVGCVAV